MLSTLPHYLPDLANLSLENNNIKRFLDLDHISMVSEKKDKFKCLRELILSGNPLRTNHESSGRLDTYKKCVKPVSRSHRAQLLTPKIAPYFEDFLRWRC